MTARGKLQRIAVEEISVIGRNTQGVRIMTLGDDDSLVAIVRVPREEDEDEPQAEGLSNPPAGTESAVAIDMVEPAVDDANIDDTEVDDIDDIDDDDDEDHIDQDDTDAENGTAGPKEE